MARYNKLLIRYACCAVVICASAALIFGQGRRGVIPAKEADTTKAKAMPLVNADPDLAVYLTKIEQLIADKDSDTAVKMIQEIIEKGEGFCQLPDDAHVYISIRRKANELLGKLGPEGLAKYRNLNDAPAEKLYQDALKSSDVVLLQRVADTYLYTTSGPKAIDALGSIYFDAGKFAQAGFCWQQMVKLDPQSPNAPAATAKIIIARYFSGDTAAADALLADLQKNFPQAKAVFSGREQDITQFIQQVRKTAVVAATTVAPANSFPGLGALAGGYGRMSDVDVVLSPRWQQPAFDPATATDVVKNLLILKGSLQPLNPQQYGPQGKTAVELRGGHIQVRGNQFNNAYSGFGGSAMRQYLLSPMLHPVVVDGKIIIRTASRIEAYDLIDGDLKWASDQPILRTLPPGTYQTGNGYMLQKMGDTGRHAVTYGSGKVFAVSNFRPYINNNMGMMRQPGQTPDENAVDNSRLIALWARSGKLVDGWEVGCGKGTDDVIRNGKFVSAPGYANNRVYAIVSYIDAGFYVVCLDAEDGRLIWKQFLAQTPALSQQYSQMADTFMCGSSPMISDGKVFAVTNLGVISAMDANSGQPLWAYQYDSQVESAMRSNPYGGQPVAVQSPNPILTARGRIICLPSDSSKVIALSVEDGSLAWQAERENRCDLTGIDEDRIAVSGPELKILSTQDGHELFAGADLKEINGRPAVTATGILLSGQGLVYHVSLADYSVTRNEVATPDCLLGDLIAVDGKLFAANALGVCAYFNYDVARTEINRRVESATGAAKLEAIYRRAQLALSAGRYDQAVEDYKTCLSPAATQLAGDNADQAREGLFKTYLAMGNAAEKPEQTVESFNSALALAQSGQEKAETKLRIAKALQRAGKFSQAASTAQELSESLGDEEICDVAIGEQANGKAKFGPKEPTTPAREIAQGFIRRLIETNGRDCYKEFDAAALKEYRRALQALEADKLEGVYQRWPLSDASTEALFAAAEMNYKASQSKADQDSQMLLARTLRQLHVICNAAPSSRQVPSAVAMAAIYSREPWGAVLVSTLLDPLRDMPANTEVSFADIKGKLGDLLAQIDSGKLARTSTPVRMNSSLDLPIREIFTLADADAFILRDENYNPLRFGESIAVLKGSRVVMFDATARNEEQAVDKWSALSTASGVDVRKRPAGMTKTVAGLSADGAILAVAGSDSITGIQMTTAKIRWQKRLADMNIEAPATISTGDGYMLCSDQLGNIAGINLATGEHWQSTMTIEKPVPQMGRQGTIIGVAQLGGGVAVIPLGQMRSLAVYSLKNGKILQKWDSGSMADAMFTPDGMLVTIIDGTLAMRDCKDINKPLWTKQYQDQSMRPSLLAVSKEFIAVAQSVSSGQIEILPIAGEGKNASTFTTVDTSGNVAIPVDAKWDDGSLYVTCSLSYMYPRRGNSNAGMLSVRNLSIQKFNPTDSTQKPVWSRSLSAETPAGNLLLPLVTGKQIAVTIKTYQQPMYGYNGQPQSPEQNGTVLLLDSKDGQILSKTISLAGHQSEIRSDRSRFMVTSTPVLLDGRLCVETNEGIMVYGK